jgi:hypothetical protein
VTALDTWPTSATKFHYIKGHRAEATKGADGVSRSTPTPRRLSKNELEVLAAKSKLGDEAGLSMIKDVFQSMKQPNPLGATLNTLSETRQMASDMDRLFRLNSCASPGVKRLQENIVLFSMGKQPIALPGGGGIGNSEGATYTWRSV